MTSNPQKAEYAFSKSILTEKTKNKYCKLYDLRNNAHILKSAATCYYPKPKEGKDAYCLVFDFISEIRSFFATQS